jgi:transketolase
MAVILGKDHHYVSPDWTDDHCSGAIGMAAIGVALWKYVMRYAPHTPTYFNRDRFVLSNGELTISIF